MKKPSLQVVASIAEIASAIAIVISILYVAYEYRESQAVSSTDVQSEIYTRMLEMDRLLIENADLAEILITAKEAPDSLTPASELRFLAYEHIFYDSWELAWVSYSNDILEITAWNDWNKWFSEDAKRRPLLGWTGNIENHEKEFIEYVEEQIGL